MSKLKKQFKRKEKKYVLSHEAFEKFQDKLEGYMARDQYGLHTICSLYYDTPQYELIRHSMDKPAYKEKLRIRSYGVPVGDSLVFLELKKKVKGTVYKSRIPMTYEKCLNYLAGREDFTLDNLAEKQTKKEIDWFLKKYPVEPKVLICYDRLAYLCLEDPDFRVTFDFNVRYRSENVSPIYGDEGQLVAPDVEILMEVKALGAYPLWFSSLLAEEKIYPASFSKFAKTYQNHLYRKEDFIHAI